MIKLSKLLISTVVLSSAFTASAYDVPMYFGADGQVCLTRFETSYGGNLLKKYVLGANPFFGFNLSNIFSIEVGYQYLKGSRTSTLGAGDCSAGTPLPSPIAPITFKSSTRIKGPHINLLVSTPKGEKFPVQFFGGVGLTQTSAVFKRDTIQICCLFRDVERKMSSAKTLVRLTFGANYFLKEDFAIRATAVFTNTKKLHSFVSDGQLNPLYTPEIKPRNSMCYGLGLRWSI